MDEKLKDEHERRISRRRKKRKVEKQYGRKHACGKRN